MFWQIEGRFNESEFQPCINVSPRICEKSSSGGSENCGQRYVEARVSGSSGAYPMEQAAARHLALVEDEIQIALPEQAVLAAAAAAHGIGRGRGAVGGGSNTGAAAGAPANVGLSGVGGVRGIAGLSGNKGLVAGGVVPLLRAADLNAVLEEEER